MGSTWRASSAPLWAQKPEYNPARRLIGRKRLPKRAKELGPLDIKRAAHPGGFEHHHYVQVGGVAGLRLQISQVGHKYWLLRTIVGDQRRTFGLGPYPEIGLAEAREKAREIKRKVEAGIDPAEERKAARAALAAAQARNLLFEDAMDRWIAARMAARPEKSRQAIRSTIRRYALPALEGMMVQEVKTQDIVRALTGVWTDKPDTAQKLRTYLEGILAWASVAGHRSGDNPAAWRGNLKELLPSISSVERAKGTSNFPAVALSEAAAWWADLSTREGMGALALRFAVLCASRSGEVRGAVWDEIDLDAGLWVIPASRMKVPREHRVPLSADAVAVLKAVPRMLNVPFVFPSVTGKMLSDMSISAVMRRQQEDAEAKAVAAGQELGRAGWRDRTTGRPAVPHGCRSTFRDWCAERGVDRDLAEICLAHTVGSDVERAYRRSDMLERRRQVLNEWSNFLHGRKVANNVLPIAAAGR
jgi:integrase